MESIELKDRVILIVDDYVINTEMISLLVSDTGATPITASNGRECVDIINKQPVDMIFMDQHMPVMDGLEATRAIRSLPKGKSIPIIGISASEDDHERDQCIQAGMNMVVNKLTLNIEKISEIAERMIFNSKCSSETLTNHNYGKDNMDCETQDIDDEIMDYVKALMEFENDTELLNSLMGDFLKNTISQLNLMKNSFDNQDFGTIQRESHGIKGGAANLCAMPLSIAAKALEMACKKHESPDTIFKLLNELNQAVDQFGRYVNKKLF
jgi:CheY-like chemotaxis protein